MLKTNIFDVAVCQQELRNYYLRTFCKIPQFPGDKRNYLSMDDIYTNLFVLINLPKPCAPIQVPLKSHHEIFTRKTDNDLLPSRILVLGNPGCGKTCLTFKLAHDWAVRNPESPLKDVSLFFTLNMRWMTPKTTLEDAIFQQLLPKDTKLTRSSLREYIETNQSTCIILFDSYDEYCFSGHFREQESGVRDILLNDHLCECQVLVTSRFWKAGDFDDLRDSYIQLQVTGFSDENVKEYILRFFNNDETFGKYLLEYLIDHNLNPGIANVPLMTLLFCMCWKESNGQSMPSKIGDLYHEVFKLLEKQYIAKNITETIDLSGLIIKAGNVAYSGLWSAEDRLVFGLQEFVDKSSEQTVNEGCKIGLLSMEHESTGFLEALHDDSNITKQRQISGSRCSVTFFHKSIQEKCAGEYLAYLCQADPTDFHNKLRYLNSARTCMRLEMVLRFACGISSKAASFILEQLMRIFKNEFSEQIQRYYEENLEPDDIKDFQKFIELCLQCYYECPDNTDLHILLTDLFHYGQMSFYGMSPYTSSAVGLFISRADIIKSLIISALPSSHSKITYGVVDQTYTLIQNALKSLPHRQLQQQIKQSGSSDFYNFCRTEVANYFRDWQSSYGINLVTIFTSLASCNQLETLNLRNVKLGNQMTSLQSAIEHGALTALRSLILFNCGLTNEQVDYLLQSIPHKLPTILFLDISYNKARLTHLGDCLVNSQIQRVYVHNMEAPAEDMSHVINKLPQFGPRMITLYMHGNVIDDDSGKVLANVLPCACQLEEFSISVNMMKRNTHKQVINAIQHLTHLTSLCITHTPYPDDLYQCISNTMGYLPQLQELRLHASKQGVSHQSSQSTLARLIAWLYGRGEQSTGDHVQHQVKRSACQRFITRLGSMEKMKRLYLEDICLHRDDLIVILALCQQHNYTMLL